MEKGSENVHQKLLPNPYLILANNPKQPLDASNFERGLSEHLLKINLVLSFDSSPFLWKRLWKTT